MTTQELVKLKDDSLLKAAVLLEMIDSKTESSFESFNRFEAYLRMHHAATLELQDVDAAPLRTPIQGDVVKALQHLTIWLKDRPQGNPFVQQAAELLQQAILTDGGGA